MQPYDLVAILVSGLAVYRIAQLVSLDDGPLQIFAKIRLFFGKRAKPRNAAWHVAEGLNCPYCVAVWVSFPAALYLEHANFWEFLVTWGAIAGVQAFLQSYSDKGEE